MLHFYHAWQLPVQRSVRKVERPTYDFIRTIPQRNLTEGQERLNTKRQELERALAGHVTESYASDSVSKKQKHRTCARYVFLIPTNINPQATTTMCSVKGSTLHVIIYSERVNLANFWSASWLSEWSIDEDKLSGSIQVRGHDLFSCTACTTHTHCQTNQVRAHNFEDGNVQLHVNKFYPVLSVSLRSDTAIIVECIKLAEETLSVSFTTSLVYFF
jgi:hypothetical protein